MKNRLHVLLISALILVAGSLYAREPQVNVVSQGENKLMMELFTYEASAVVRILDDKGYILFSEKTGKSPAYSKVFDLAPLPVGSYRFEIEGENTIQVIDFKVLNNKINMIGKVETYYKPVMLHKGEMVDLQLLNSAELPVTVSFRDSSGNLLLLERPDDSIRIEKRYKLSELERGVYSMTVQVGSRSYFKRLVIE